MSIYLSNLFGRNGEILFFIGIVILSLCVFGSFSHASGPSPGIAQSMDQGSRPLSLQDCVEIALQNNHRRPASRFSMEIAEAQHQQSLSAYWPQVAFKSTFSLMDQDPNFIFPEYKANIPSSTIIVTTPLGSMPLTIPAQAYTIPQQNIKLMDKQNIAASLNLSYPLYTGGLIGAKVKQAKKGIEAARHEIRRTDLQIINDVKQMYYSVVTSHRLLHIAQESLSRMEVTLRLTESLYKRGSGRVKKTDYLRNKAVVEGMRSASAFLEGNAKNAKAALTNIMGVGWAKEIVLSENEVPFSPYKVDLNELVKNAYILNPDWARMKAGLDAAGAKVQEAKSGNYPIISLFGSLTHIDNSYHKGITTNNNRTSSVIGVAIEFPIFSGFRTTNEIKEAIARLGKLKEEQMLLEEGIALQVKHLFIQMATIIEQKLAMEAAVKAAEENRDLNERAYQNELVEAKDVIESQFIESFMKAQYYKLLFDHFSAQAHMDFVIGTEAAKLFFGEKPLIQK